MTRLDKTRRIELGRRYALNELTLDEAVKEYGVHKSTVWAARKDYLRERAIDDTPAVDKTASTGKPERPPVDHAYVTTLEEECTRLNTEVRTLQKIVMTLGRAL